MFLLSRYLILRSPLPFIVILFLAGCHHFSRSDAHKLAIEASVAYYGQKGDALFRTGAFDQAAENYRMAINLAPSRPELYHNLGVCFIMMSRYDSAIVYLQTATLLRPSYLQAHLDLAKAFWQSGDTSTAIAICRKALIMDPTNSETFFLLGQLYEKQELLDQALNSFKRAILLDPGNMEARNNLGIIYYRKGQLDKAIEEFERVLRSSPKNYNAYYNLGKALIRRCMFEQALAAYQEAVKLAPDNPEPFNSLGVCYTNLNRYEEALKAFRTVARLDSGQAFIYYNISIVLAKMDSIDAARNASARAIALDSTNARFHFQHGNISVLQRDIGQAARAFLSSTRFDSTFAPAHRNLGSALLELNDIDNAIYEYRAAVRTYPALLERRYQLRRSVAEQGVLDFEALCGTENALEEEFAGALNDLGKAYIRAGKLDSARWAFNQAIELFPGSIQVYNNLGSLLLQQGQRNEASQYFARAHLNSGLRFLDYDSVKLAMSEFDIASRRYPGWSEPLVQKALVLSKSGQTREAQELLKQALLLDPKAPSAYLGLAKLFASTGAIDDAIDACKTATKLDPGNLEIQSLYVDLLRRKGAREARTAEINYRYWKGKNHEDEGFLDRAMEEYHAILDLDSLNVKTRNALGLVLIKIGLTNEAEIAFRLAISADPESAEGYYGLGLILGEKQKYGEALVVLEKALQFDPGLAEAHYAMAVNYFFLNQYEKAKQAVEKAREYGYRVNENFLRELQRALAQ